MKTKVNANLELEVYTELLVSLIEHDYRDLWSSDTAMRKDLLTLSYAIGHDGIQLLTKELPRIGKALDRYLATGEPLSLIETGLVLSDGTRMCLFEELWNAIFGDDRGLLPTANHRSVAGLRQLLLMFYKLELPYSHEDSNRVLDGFVANDASLPQTGDIDYSVDPVLRRARGLIGSVCGGLDPQDIVPCHGTGAVATREDVLGKSKFSRIYSSVESKYPFAEYFRFSLTHLCDTLHEVQDLEHLPAPQARVALVPKDSRGPRIISMEPLEIQWLQQGLMRELVPHIESHPLTKGHVNFTDQSINRELAQSSSIADDWVTLDMKDASDLVSLPIVEYFFGGTRLLDGLLATRSTETLLPDGRVVTLRKYAPMGSALCFPIESLVFWATAVAVLWTGTEHGKLSACRSVYVYGDDLIVPKAHWKAIAEKLQQIHLVINETKSCVATRFRESCGFDAFDGMDVSPLRIKTRLTGRPNRWLPSYVALSNAAYDRGLKGLAEAISTVVRREIRRHAERMYPEKRDKRKVSAEINRWTVPYTDKPCGVLSYVRPYTSRVLNMLYEGRVRTRYNKELQRMEIQGLTVRTRMLKPAYDGYIELLRRWSDLISVSDNPETLNLSENMIQMIREGFMAKHRIPWPVTYANPNSGIWRDQLRKYGWESAKRSQRSIRAAGQQDEGWLYADGFQTRLRRAWAPLD